MTEEEQKIYIEDNYHSARATFRVSKTEEDRQMFLMWKYALIAFTSRSDSFITLEFLEEYIKNLPDNL